MSTTMDLRHDDPGVEPLPEGEPGAFVLEPEATLPWIGSPARATRRRKRFRLSRRWRLVRTGVFVLVLELGLSGLGVLPGSGWPLSLLGSSGAATAGSKAAGTTPALVGSRPSDEAAAKSFVPPAAWAFAQVKGLTIYVPTHRMLAIGYHEAATTDGLPLTPLGRCVINDNPSRFRIPPATAGPDYLILISRHRRAGATTAADVAMPRTALVVAPISGVVMKVQAYRLYKYWLDYRIEISPGRGSRLRVVLIHLTDIMVHRGQVLVAGQTPLAHPRVFPFKSDINDYVGAGIPHVHLEVKEIGPPRRKA